jgi:B-box zinc finger
LFPLGSWTTLLSYDYLTQQINIADKKPAVISNKEKCEDHGIDLYYYCHDCKKGLCSDCAVLDTSHRNHKVEHLEEVYKRHYNTVKHKTIPLRFRLGHYKSLKNAVRGELDSIEKEEASVKEQYELIYKDACRAITSQAKAQAHRLSHHAWRLDEESAKIDGTLKTLEAKLSEASKIHIINHSEEIVDLIAKVFTLLT